MKAIGLLDVKIKKLNDRATIPTKGTMSSAGYDLYSNAEDKIEIKPYETKFISTGISIEIPDGYYGGIYARSGLACKHGLRPANCVGVIDSDYRGEIIVALHNDSNETKIIEPNERIAQIIITPFLYCNLIESDNLSDTSRNDGGFGSTGTN